MARVSLRALGECVIETEVARIAPDSRVVFALALYLVLERGKRIPRQTLVDLFWPDVKDERRARHCFRQTLLRLKQVGIPITADQSHLTLDRNVASTDFDALLEVNGDAESVVSDRDSLAFLPHYQPKFSEEFNSWLELHRARVHLSAQRVFVHALKSAHTRGDWNAVEKLAIDCLRLDPLNEEATMARAEATVMRGSKALALRILDTYMDALGDRSLAIGLPAKMLRSRIADRMTQPHYAALSESHFVGREVDVALLTEALENGKRGNGGAFLLVGDAGIGKTRLLNEISRVAELKGIAVAGVRCQPTSVDRPIAVLADLVSVLRTLRGSLGVSVQSLSLLQRLTEYTDPVPVSSDFGEAGVSGAAIRRAVFDLFEALADENTLLVAVEDAQWADQFSWKILNTIAEWAVRKRVVLMVTSRRTAASEHGPAIDTLAPFCVRELAPLTSAASVSLVEKLAADYGSDIPSDMLSWCVAVAEGNPYYLRELLMRWLETHEPFGVPHSLAELIDRRLGRLSAEALRVFQACVAFGSSCTLARLERVEATQPAQLPRALEELSLSGVIVCDGTRVHAKHELLSQAAGKRLSPALKLLLHRRIAGVLEAERGDEPVPAILWECAHHWEVAGEGARAVQFLDDCGRHLVSVGLPEEAAALYRRALGLQVPECRQRVALHEGLIRALRQNGLLEQVLAEIPALRETAHDGGCDLERHSELELVEIEARWRSEGATSHVLEMLLRCVRAPDASPTHRLNAAYWALAFAQGMGRADWVEVAWRAVEPLVLHSAGDPAARFQVAMAYHTDYGDLEQACTHAERFVELARAKGDPLLLVRALRNAALALRRAGLLENAEALLVEAFDLGIKYHVTLGATDAAHQLCSLAIQRGALETANEWLEHARHWSKKCESRVQASDLAVTAACIAMATWNTTGARQLLVHLPDWRTDLNLRRRQVVSSLFLGVQSVDPNSAIDSSLLAACEDMYVILRSSGHQDFCVACLARAYQTTGNTRKAVDLVSAYLRRFRRDRGPVTPALQLVAQSLRNLNIET